ncbi:MAG: leucine-rich repeat domain-containing protein [Krumholzibacteria bacterium]|nr:leucine-rich repeat domain-containing protein [Candidatus Krumholzibacteria bacterium]
MASTSRPSVPGGRRPRLSPCLLVLAALVGCASSTDPGGDEDLGPPAPITDLRVTAFTATSVTLAWTATGDDGDRGTCARYELRRHEAFLYPANWDEGVVVPGLPAPAPAGQPESFTATGLQPESRAFFALSAWDDAGNSFGVSNCAEALCIDNTEVAIPDAALEAAVRARLGIPTAPLRRLDLRGLGDLTAEEAGIVSLAGLQECPNLEVLHLRGNAVADLGPLAALARLRHLGLVANQVADLAPLADLPALQVLWLDDDPVASLAPLAGLTSLQALHLDRTGAADLTALASLTGLRELRLAGNAVTDLAPLAGLTTLETLDLMGNSLGSLAPLAGLTSLQWLSVRSCGTPDLSPLAPLVSLTHLDAVGDAVTDLTPLAGLTALTRAMLANNAIADLTPLAGLTGLEVLALGGNAVTNVAPLAALAGLSHLYLYANALTDLTPLAGLENLAVLHIHYNRIADLAPLVANAGLGQGDEVDVGHNPLSATALAEQIPALEARGVSVLQSR